MEILVVGAGLYGATMARVFAEHGHHVTVIDRRKEFGGNAATENVGGITVHKYGAHIFHTNDAGVWAFANRFAKFNGYVHRVSAINEGRRYTLPFNLDTYRQIWPELETDAAITARLEHERRKILTFSHGKESIARVGGEEPFNLLIRDYTAKQWGCEPSDVDPAIIGRIPVRLDHDDRYFDDTYQGIPWGGYSVLVENMLSHSHITVKLGKNVGGYWLAQKAFDQVVYTGSIDELFGYQLGELPYRSLKFKAYDLPADRLQQNAVENYTGAGVAWTRSIEHKLFSGVPIESQPKHTVITLEFPQAWERGRERYYPIASEASRKLYAEYLMLAKQKTPKFWFGGRLGGFSYINMDQAIRRALDDSKKIWRDLYGR